MLKGLNNHVQLGMFLANNSDSAVEGIPSKSSRELAEWECALQLCIALGCIHEVDFNKVVGAITHERNIVRKEDR